MKYAGDFKFMDNNTQKIPVIVVAGPTASGKTALSVEIAKHYDGEVVGADSMQIYKFMNIATAKPTQEEMCGIFHHMIDIVYPDEKYSVAHYAKDAKKCISDIRKRGKIPVMVGGTGLYIDNVLQNISLAQTDTDYNLREKLMEDAETNGYESMHRKLAQIDPDAAKKIHPNNIRRVIRALEVFYTTGMTFTHQIENSKKNESNYDSIIFMPDWNREELYKRIEMRVDIMAKSGMYDEFLSLLDKGYTRKLNSMQAIGYKELFDYYRGLCSFDEAIELIKKHSRNYAKRQITWFKRNKDIIMLDAHGDMQMQCFEKIDKWIKKF